MKTAGLLATWLIAMAVPPRIEAIKHLDVPDSVKPVKQTIVAVDQASGVAVDQTIVAVLGLLPEFMQPTVDVSFSLECQVIESEWHKSLWNRDWDGSMEEQELTRGGAYHHDPDSPWGREYYDKGPVRIAFNHGVPDGNSYFAVDKLRVTQATLEGYNLKHEIGATDISEDGFFDRRTGKGLITWYQPKAVQKMPIPALKQFAFKCEPSL